MRTLSIAVGDHDMQCPPKVAGKFIKALGSNTRLIMMPEQGYSPYEAELNKIIMAHNILSEYN